MSARLYAVARLATEDPEAERFAHFIGRLQGEQRLFITEVAPMRITVNVETHSAYVDDEDDDIEVPFTTQIWTPYVVAITPRYGQGLRLFARRAPLSADDEVLYHLSFPHIRDTGEVCFYPRMPSTQWSAAAQAVFFMNEYFTTNYGYFLTFDTQPEPLSLDLDAGNRDMVVSFFAELAKYDESQTLALPWQTAHSSLQEPVRRWLGVEQVPLHIDRFELPAANGDTINNG